MENFKLRISEAYELAKYFISAGKNILFVSQPGLGKSEMQRQIASELGYDLLTFFPPVDDPLDYKGALYVNNGIADFLPIGKLRLLLTAIKPLIVNFDEIGQCAPAMQNAVAQLILNREINGEKISEHVRFTACTNDKSHKSGVQALHAHLLDRFYAIFNLQFDMQDFISYGLKNNFDSTLLAFCKFSPNYLTDWIPQQGIEHSITPRRIEYISNTLQDSIAPISRNLIASMSNMQFASEFWAFRQILSSLPNLNEIIQGQKVRFDFEPSLLYVIIMRLIPKVDHNNIENIFSWIQNLTIEMQSVFVSLTLSAKPGILEVCSKYNNWLIQNQTINNF